MKNISGTHKRCLNGFEVKHFSNWESHHGHWQLSEKAKKYIIFAFTDDKERFQRECPGLKVRRITQTRAIKMLLDNGECVEKLSEIGNYPKWWNELFSEQGVTS